MFNWAKRLKVTHAGTLVAVTMATLLTGCDLEYDPAFPKTPQEAHRFLTQATFGPDEAGIQRVMTLGYSAWIDEQFALKPTFTYRSFWTKRNAEIAAASPGSKATPDQVLEAFFTRALTDPAQLRARMAFALSEIFVVSFTDGVLQSNPEMVAYHGDLLDTYLDGNYRQLLEGMAKSPALGQYLTYRSNNPEDPSIGRFPDENFAREVMQLLSIGLYELNNDGTVKRGGNGKPIETYTNDDIKGLAKVFTGWSNYRGSSFGAVSEAKCFMWDTACRDPEGFWRPMVAYPAYHSVSAKTFLGVTVPAQGTPSPQVSLTAALDRLASHPNTAPFISKQLIQRFVTSNPSPAYVQRVATRFLETGGSLKETMKAILLDDEARNPAAIHDQQGKLREPLLRLTAILRAFPFTAPTLQRAAPAQPYLSLGMTGDDSTSFGQAPFYAPSVFNFFRPGYTPPQSLTAASGLVAPEMQLVHEASTSGYFNAVQELLTLGIGPNVTPTQRNVTLAFAALHPVAKLGAAQLVLHTALRLKGSPLDNSLFQVITAAVDNIPIPEAGTASADAIARALNQRISTAILMVAVSPEFLVTQ